MPIAASSMQLHVVTLTPFYPTAHDDARGCFVAEPLGALARQRISNTVISAQPFYRSLDLPHPGAPAAEVVRYLSFPGGLGLSSAGALLFARLVARIRKLHAIHQIDMIHAHAPLPCGHAAMLLARELRIPYVVSVHGLDAYSTNQVQGRAGNWCRRVTQHVFRQATRVICISEHVREEVLAGGDNVRTSVVYNGVDRELFAPRAPSSQTAPSILSVGNLIPIKAHDVLIRAVAAAHAQHPDLSLDIVGDGPERGRLVALVHELGLSNAVRFLGRRSRKEVADLMGSATLFALPSRYEGLGCVYLEAMASGTVAIGCRGQGIEEVIRHASSGWLVGIDNVNELTSGISTLLSNPELRRSIAEQGRRTILHGLTLSHQAEALRHIYEESLR